MKFKLKNLFFAILTITISTLLILLVCEGIFRLVNLNKNLKFLLVDQPGRKVGLYEYDENLGWKNRPNYERTFNWSYRETLEKINSKGLRDKEYTFEKDEDVFRIAIIGCSRTYGYGVNMEETYSKELERLLNKTYPQKFEVINFGVNGYGLSQMTLNYLNNARKYSPDIVILQLYLPTVFRASQTKMWGTQKPTYILKNDELVLINSPVPDDKFKPFEKWLIDKSNLYKFVKDKLLKIEEIQKLKFKDTVPQNEELHALTAKLLSYLNNEINKDNAQFIVFSWGTAEWLKDPLSVSGVEFFILEDYADFESWKKIGNTENPPPTGHWSPIGNQYVAESIFNYLTQTKLAQ